MKKGFVFVKKKSFRSKTKTQHNFKKKKIKNKNRFKMSKEDQNKDDCASTDTLSTLFDRGFDLHNSLDDGNEDTASPKYQDSVRKSILILEDCTRLVSALDLFSHNECVSEVPTEHLKYFLLPALLGCLQAKVRDEGVDRSEVIKVQEAYFRDFLRRCNEYEICQVEVPEPDEDDGGDDEKAVSARSGPPDMEKMNREREAKMKRYKEKQLLEERLKELQAAVKEGRADEDDTREYQIKVINKFVNVCLDEFGSFAMEKPILRHMKAIRAGKVVEAPKQKPRPLKPIIITRDAAQKEVFGMGYKNLPIMSVEEFYEQRVRDGWFPAPGEAKKQAAAAGSLQDRAMGGEREDEKEGEERDRKEDEDDEEELARKRRMDEYKDTHRRGEGNRHNMG